ncbi:hypothetical protein G3435_05430 [Pseudomonas sp. MAFF212428]|uniref:Lipoprotein n=1 Tax=Pseudomonas brassicae TaxID=2708063 RepID=A0A6B3NTF9_9PSED|nr:hypothetical protein [Pseudomonas brassicae]NER59583.1 hypothetical protein [Pseudomonas brassicae]NER63708.1 hypothetical protein [Pseudomonas brassicae]
MKIVKTLLLASLVSTLAGCGSDAIEGKFNVQASVMGFKSNVGTAELDEDYITLLGDKYQIDEWTREGDHIIARGKDGEAVMNARVEDNGNRLVVLDGGELVSMTLTRIQ